LSVLVQARPVAPPMATIVMPAKAIAPAIATRSAIFPGDLLSPRIASHIFLMTTGRSLAG
jgi:hypothetical protein